MPDEIRHLIVDALEGDKTYEQKMYYLGIANAMAAMYKHWHSDEKPLIEVETVIRIEVQREKDRIAEVEKWKKYEKFLGNILLREHEVQMTAAGLPPVVFPHWLHRIWFQCKVCHEDVFVTKRRGNDISMAHILEGRQCGVCHNGKTAFGLTDDCFRCHNAGRPGTESLYNVAKIDHKMVKEIASRLGAEWNPENLASGVVPVDKFGFIKWLELKDKKVFNPVGSLNKGLKDEGKVRDNKILFESASPVVNNVIFDHKIHSAWVECATCHPAIFSDELGEDRVTMANISAGKFCGHCHGRISFTFADCLRCHNQPKGERVKGALIHKAKP
jgi:c(7)-type cytochrome triheme protein